MARKNPEIIIPKTRDKTRKTRKQKMAHKAWKMGLSFLLGVTVTSIVHAVMENQRIRATVEKACVVFGKEEQECKESVDDVMSMMDSITQNNANIKDE